MRLETPFIKGKLVLFSIRKQNAFTLKEKKSFMGKKRVSSAFASAALVSAFSVSPAFAEAPHGDLAPRVTDSNGGANGTYCAIGGD